MDLILKALKELHVGEFRLVEKKTYSKEWFFIKKKLDMSRAKEVTHYYLTIYQTNYQANDRFKGQASAKISPSLSLSEIKDVIAQLTKEASYVYNPYFDLPSFMVSYEEKLAILGDVQAIFEMMDDFYESEEISLNSYELFETFEEVRIVNSKGLDVSYVKPNHQLELVINSKDDHHEVEIYQDLRFGQPNITDLKTRIGEACRFAQDRKQAKPTIGVNQVLISKENVLSLMRYYLMQLNTDYIFNQYSHQELGNRIGPDHLHLEGMPFLENSSRNIPFDEDGRTVQAVSLIENGRVQHLWGPHISSSYLGLDDTTMVYNYKVGAGNMSVEEMKKEPYLELVQFSSFSCHPITGDFSGEIRLGYYYDGLEVVPVTGGSVSGNIKDCEHTMVLSKELVKYDYAVVPQTILLKNVNIAV